MIKPLLSYFLKRVYMNMLKTMIATAIVATSASAMATEAQVAPATVVTLKQPKLLPKKLLHLYKRKLQADSSDCCCNSTSG